MQEHPLTPINKDESPDAENKRINATRPSKDSLKITEIFFSLQGESTTSGIPTIFIRLTGCPLRCTYCDSEYAFYGGEWMTYQAILDTIAEYPTQYICVTGGEPLAQRACADFLSLLCDKGYNVSLETSGAMSIKEIDNRVTHVMDLKTPDSGEESRNKYENIQYLKPQDQIKFVICSHADFEWAQHTILSHNLTEQCLVLMSASYEQLAPKKLADWIVEAGLPVRFQLQIHKYLWGDIPGV